MSQKGKGVRMFKENGLSFFALYLLTDDPKKVRVSVCIGKRIEFFCSLPADR